MLINKDNPFIELLRLLGCDLSATVTSWKDIAILGFEFLFACLMLYLLCKFLYGMMCRLFRGRF